MISKIKLARHFFTEQSSVIFSNQEFTVSLRRYQSQVEAVEIANSRGKVVVLPFMGQMIWDLEFDGISLKMKNMFSQPKPAACIIDTYGCFAFHSGLIANGCPAPEDMHPLHGEMPCAIMDEAWLEIDENSVAITGRVEYAQGFGHHYAAYPCVRLGAQATKIEIGMRVENLATVPMPLQYMCHMNYAYVTGGRITSNLPEAAFKLRQSIPAHVKPTEQWLAFNEKITALQATGHTLTELAQPELYDPEIVFMADRIDQYGERAVFELDAPEGHGFSTEFSTRDFPSATRWILYNGDQQVAAFVLPATCRPEGFLAAQQAGTLIMLAPGTSKDFSVITGKK